MAERLLIFDTQSLARLITHYSDGEAMPLDAEVLQFQVHPHLQRIICLLVQSGEWFSNETQANGELQPLQFRYEGKRTMRWGSKHEEVQWSDAPSKQL